jgi:hypothetical protein
MIPFSIIIFPVIISHFERISLLFRYNFNFPYPPALAELSSALSLPLMFKVVINENT